MIQHIPKETKQRSFEKQLRAYLTDASEFDIARIIEMHEATRPIKNYIVEEKIVQLNKVNEICPQCQRKHNEIKQLVSLEKVENAVVYVTGVDRAMLATKSRKRIYVQPRQVIMYLTYKYSPSILKEIGQRFNRDHTTVIHSNQVVKDLLDTDPAMRSLIHTVEEILFKKPAL